MPATKLRQDSVRTLVYSGTNNSQCIHWDEALPCFGLRIYPNGRRSYVCSYRVHGRKRIATLGRADVLTLDQARKKARAFLGHACSGDDPQAREDAINASSSVKALCLEYIERHAIPKKKTWKADQLNLNCHVIPKLGSRLAATITTNDIAQLHLEIGRKTPYAANRVIEIVKKMFNLAHHWRRVPADMQNPASGIEKFPERKRRRFVTTAEMPRLVRALEDEFNEYARHALWLLLLTGVRRSELLRAKWSDVDWDQRTLSIGTTKNGDPVLAPLSHAAIDRLKMISVRQGNPYIICGTSEGSHLVNLSKPWSRVRKAADIEDVRIHDLRRTVGSWLVRSGASLHLVGSVLNHKDQKTTAGYAYFQTEDRTQVLDAHGDKVTAGVIRSTLTTNPSRAHLDKQSIVSATQISSRRTHRLSREALYKLVWSFPILKVAAQLGVSDVGLAKACRRAHIPIPPRGFWAKRQAGKTTQTVPPLPYPSDVSAEVTIRISSKQQLLRSEVAKLTAAA